MNMMNRFMKWAVPKLEDWCEKRGKVYHICGRQGDDDVYLVRYFLLRTKYLSIYIHRFLRSDIDDMHDHPFDFLGYIVSGSYRENMLHIYENGYRAPQSRREEGTWAFRKAEDIHMVLLDKEYKLSEKKKAPLTVIFRGPWRRDWGFWKFDPNTHKHTWEIWNKYLGVPYARTRE